MDKLFPVSKKSFGQLIGFVVNLMILCINFSNNIAKTAFQQSTFAPVMLFFFFGWITFFQKNDRQQEEDLVTERGHSEIGGEGKLKDFDRYPNIRSPTSSFGLVESISHWIQRWKTKNEESLVQVIGYSATFWSVGNYINFRWVKPHFRTLYFSLFGIIWLSILSFIAHNKKRENSSKAIKD